MRERIKPGYPEENEIHEWFHRTLKQETMSPPAADLAAQQKVYASFRMTYNNIRPHEALSQVLTATIYKPSPRLYSERPKDIEYPPLTIVRRLRSNSQIK